MISATPPIDRGWSWTRRDLAVLMAVVVLALGVRWVVIGPELGRLDDPDSYLKLARSLARGDGFAINSRPTAYRPPLYPLLLVPLVAACGGPKLAGGICWLHLGLGGITVALVADAGRRSGLSRLAVGLASLIVAFDPVLVVQARGIMTETLAAALVAGTLWGTAWAGRSQVILGGIGFGLASLCRPSLLPAAFLTAGCGCLLGPGIGSARVRRSVAQFGVVLAILAPWAVRNRVELGSWIWTTTHGGYTLALANNAAYYGDVLNGPPAAVWSGPNQVAWIDSINAATAGRTEPESDRLLRRAAIDFARENLRDFARATGARLARFWGIMPAAAVYPKPLRWVIGAWTVPFWALALIGVISVQPGRWSAVVALCFIATLTLVHSVYWTDLRMRAPIVPALALIAAGGLERLVDVGTRRSSTPVLHVHDGSAA